MSEEQTTVYIVAKTKYTERVERLWAFSTEERANAFIHEHYEFFERGHEVWATTAELDNTDMSDEQ